MAPTKLSVASAAYKFQRGPFHSANNNHKGECTCSAINEEANELNCLCKKACSSSFISHFSEAKKSYKSTYVLSFDKLRCLIFLQLLNVPNKYIILNV